MRINKEAGPGTKPEPAKKPNARQPYGTPRPTSTARDRRELARLVADHPSWLLRPDHLEMLQTIARRIMRGRTICRS